MGAPSRKDPVTNSSTSSRTSSTMSLSTRSALVSTTIPRGMPSRRQMSKCSRVCGLMDSSAATTNRTRSRPPTPASMFFTNRSCPGTSTKPSLSSGVNCRWAKPMSMVMPRRFSSSRRSASMPVRARTRAVLPWSMCPAVPAIIFFMPLLLMLLLGGGLLAQQKEEIPVFRAGVTLVRVDIEVTGSGNADLSDFTQRDFRIFDENQPQEIVHFGRESEPLDLLLLLDVSGSMRRSLEEVAAGARAALGRLHTGDRVALMLFSRRAEV